MSNQGSGGDDNRDGRGGFMATRPNPQSGYGMLGYQAQGQGQGSDRGGGGPGEELETDGLRSEAELMRMWAQAVRGLASAPPETVAQAAHALADHIDDVARNMEQQASELDRQALREVRSRGR